MKKRKHFSPLFVLHVTPNATPERKKWQYFFFVCTGVSGNAKCYDRKLVWLIFLLLLMKKGDFAQIRRISANTPREIACSTSYLRKTRGDWRTRVVKLACAGPLEAASSCCSWHRADSRCDEVRGWVRAAEQGGREQDGATQYILWWTSKKEK